MGCALSAPKLLQGPGPTTVTRPSKAVPGPVHSGYPTLVIDHLWITAVMVTSYEGSQSRQKEGAFLMMETDEHNLKIKERGARPQRKLIIYQNVQDGRSSAGGERCRGLRFIGQKRK